MIAEKVKVKCLLTMHDLKRMFRRSVPTLLHWRQFEGMPYIRIKGRSRDSVRYERARLLQWARVAGKEVFDEAE